MKTAVLSSSQGRPAWPDDQEYSLAAEEFWRIQTQLPSDVLLLAAPVDNWMDKIDPAEREIVRQAVPSRQAEFSTGRMLAAQALEEIGTPFSAILRGPMNEPVWPAGTVGSITHTREICLVAVATTKQTLGLGIDIEANCRDIDDLAHLILRPEERQTTASQDLPKKDAVRAVFCAKEALYKAIHGRARRFVDFQEVRVEFDPDTGNFTAIAPEDQNLDALVRQGSGRFLIADSTLFAVWHQKS
jgi:4'-phosphopantetheinyl transferase EntD